ncbi:MAG: phosphoribosyltransferase, partial [Clostridiales bacterium]|nr:phosphoribosyltransferase [Clostridiales bacterium]
VRKKGAKKVIVAIPVSPSITLYVLKSYVDEIICLQIPEPFYSIGTYYNNFAEIDDDEINDLINKLKKN